MKTLFVARYMNHVLNFYACFTVCFIHDEVRSHSYSCKSVNILSVEMACLCSIIEVSHRSCFDINLIQLTSNYEGIL